MDRQGEYEERYLHQRAGKMYAHGYRRPQINDSIVAPLDQEPDQRTTVLYKPPTELRSQQQGLRETVDEYYDKLKRLYKKSDPTGRYLSIDRICQFTDRLRQELRKLRSYLNHESYNNEENSELKKAIAEMAKNMKTLVQRQNEHKITVKRDHIARNCQTQRSFGYNNGGAKQNRPNNGQERSHGPNRYTPNISSRNNQNQVTNNCPNNNNNSNNNNNNTNNNDNRTAQGESNGNQTYLTLTRKELTRAIEAAIRNHLNIKIETLDISQPPIEVMYCKTTIEQQPIYLILDTELKVTEAKDYAVIVETDWLEKVREKIDLAKGELEYEWKSDKYRMPITCWKRMTYNFEKPVSLEEKSEINSEEIDEKENEEEYEVKEVEEERGPGTVCWCEKWLNGEEESCTKCKELFQDIETLECLVNNLDKELEVSWETQEFTNLEKNQQAKVEELMKNNKVLFAEGLMQLERTKEEMHSITLKEEVDPLNKDHITYHIWKTNLYHGK
ncbi:hypothetical protein F8M41_005559 [Gigaspora margarita]|uniref:Uncharacterized protein n=1 Tax=Gigaspora margarita TaxID=4874 RepID=A0A8H4A4V8_GIGMA|nr:hypothetical protein F8M41_005559 [Gigaspora margarita]